MKVLAINGSPRGEKSSTAHILKPLLEGMRRAGATTEIVHLSKMKVNHCLGCYMCWTKTPGKCIQKDDMEGLLEKYVNSDAVILGTPLYHFTMSGLLKNFIERTLPVCEPWLIENPNIPGATTHPERYDKPKAMALVSPCGFPEFSHFDTLSAWFKHYVKEVGKKNLGEIYRPSAEALSREEMQDYFKTYYDSVRTAGEEMIKLGSISEDVEEQLKWNLFPGDSESFRKKANEHWTVMIEKYKKHGE